MRLYDRLFKAESPGEEGDDFLKDLNPGVVRGRAGPRRAERSRDAPAGERVQFERVGYFCVDADSKPGALVFNRTIGLKDSWAAKQGK